MVTVRDPYVNGAFYPDSESNLASIIDEMIKQSSVDMNTAADAKSFVAPHAGYRYSGPAAAYTYKAVAAKASAAAVDTFIVIGPNHTGNGDPIAVSVWDWRTPLGICKNDIEFSNALAAVEPMSQNELAHMGEHSIEVQLPFLQSTVKDPHCVFVCMGDQSIDAASALSNGICKVEMDLGRRVTVIASSDFNHYEAAKVAKAKDTPAIEAICRLDVEGFYGELKRNEDSACGYGPIAVAALFGKAHGAKGGLLLKYTNSGDANRDYNSVVAYASMLFR